MRSNRSIHILSAILLLLAMPLLYIDGTDLRGGVPASSGRPGRVIVLGIDGMDYGLTRSMMSRGLLPNMSRIAETGTFKRLETSTPPLSPVAWTNFITGTNPGGHGVFDFLRRDPERVGPGFLPEDAVSKIDYGRGSGGRRIPLTPYVTAPDPTHELLRHGRAFWEVLGEDGVGFTILRVPANYPACSHCGRVLSGMGTPDIEGTYGMFTYITSVPEDWGRRVSGGRVLPAQIIDGSVEVRSADGAWRAPYLHGPPNPFLPQARPVSERRVNVPFEIVLDAGNHTAVIILQGRPVVLKRGEWSDWVSVSYNLLPLVKSVRGMVRFYLKQADGQVRLYVSAVHLYPGFEGLAGDGLDLELSEAIGLFHTKGMSEDTKAFTQGILSRSEYDVQSLMVFEEDEQALKYLIDERRPGLLFAYFSTIDLNSHVLWKYRDAGHPDHPAGVSPEDPDPIEALYIKVDSMIGHVLRKMTDDDQLYVMSDHGFTSMRYRVNLASWLEQQGYLAFHAGSDTGQRSFEDVDWEKTRAFVLGWNGLYINMAGRESRGSVAPEAYDTLVEEIRTKLLSLEHDGNPVIMSVVRPAEVYSGPLIDEAPDLILGYSAPYGPDDLAVLGTTAEEVVFPSKEGFSGHHVTDPSVVPGVLLSTRGLSDGRAGLEDVTVTLLSEFGVAPLPTMTGRSLLKD